MIDLERMSDLYLESIDKAVADKPEQLARLIREGWCERDELFRRGRY